MSRIGKLPIKIPKDVKVEVKKSDVIVKGKLGTIEQKIDSEIEVVVDNDEVILKRPTEQKRHKSLHGLYRSLINNMVIGVSKGFEHKLELVGVGYRATATGQALELNLGYSHAIVLVLPDEIKMEVDAGKRGQNPVITLRSYDKQLLGQVVAKIRSFRPPEPYKGKGIKFVGEELRRKAGKSAAAK